MTVSAFNEWVTAIGGVVIIFGGGFAAFQLWLMTRQGHREFESLYVQRYWDLIDRLGVDAALGKDSARVSRKDRRHLVAYVQLCEDEADMFEQGRVTSATWTIWQSGIDAMLRLPVVEEIIYASEPGKFDTLKRYRSEGRLRPKYGRFGRFIRGL